MFHVDLFFRPDCTIQDIVYKLLPHLEKGEYKLIDCDICLMITIEHANFDLTSVSF